MTHAAAEESEAAADGKREIDAADVIGVIERLEGLGK
jgi:hypothetical protein